MSDQDAKRFIIQLDIPGQPLDMENAVALLEPSGVEIDRSYGPICVDRAAGRYVVRGTVTEAAQKRIESMQGVQLFIDSPLDPARGQGRRDR